MVAEDGQHFSVMISQLLRDGSSCAGGEIAPIHKTEAPRWTSAKVVDLRIMCDRISLDLKETA